MSFLRRQPFQISAAFIFIQIKIEKTVLKIEYRRLSYNLKETLQHFQEAEKRLFIEECLYDL